MAALLTGDIPGRNFKKKDAVVEHIEDCRRMGIAVAPPDVNASDVEFTPREGTILFGLSAIKGCGGATPVAIKLERDARGPFRDLFDFCERIDTSAVNRSAIEMMVKAGAMDSFGAKRSQLTALIDRAIQSGAARAKDRAAGQMTLFDMEESTDDGAPDVPESG